MKIKCYLVQDLLPLYIEHLASDETMADVREHLQECDECRLVLEDISKAQLALCQEKSVNLNEMDYLVKIKKHITKRSIISSIILSFVVFVTIMQFKWGNFNSNTLYILLPLFIGLGYFSLLDVMKKEKKVGYDFWVINIVVTLINFCIIIFYMMIEKWFVDWDIPFGLSIGELGPFIENVLRIMLMLMIGVITYGIIKVYHKSILYYVLVSHSLSSIIMISSYIYILKQLSDISFYKAGMNNSILLFFEGAFVTVVIWIWIKRKYDLIKNKESMQRRLK